MNIASLLTQVKNPDRPAIIFSGKHESKLTFRELDDLSSRLATGLEAKGLLKGERVVALTPISPMLYATLIAIFKVGATAVFLDPQTKLSQLNRAIELANARAFIGSRKVTWLKYISPALRRIPLLFSIQNMPQTFSQPTHIAEVDEDQPALITFTSGSTDTVPRGVLRTHHLLIAQHHALSRILPFGEDDVDLPAFPVATLHNLASGITSVIPDFPFRKPDAVQPEKILRQINQYEITTASGSPAYWSVIIEHCLRFEKKLSLRRIVMGGAPTSPKLLKQLSQIAPNAEILNLYGSTEAEPVAALGLEDVSDEMTRRIETGAGIPLGRGVEEACVHILDKNHHQQLNNQVGEIWISGEHVARGYFSNPTADRIHKHFDTNGDLWHRMGDMGYKDDDGWLWLVGRVNNLVTRDMKLIYPVCVEMVAETLPFVRRAALIGVADKILNERAVLFVEFSRDVSLINNWREEIMTLLVKQNWFVDEIYSIKKIPVDARHNARIDYQKLKLLAESR